MFDDHTGHIPVLRNEALEWLNIQPGRTYVDATFGGGGYARALLDHDIKKLYVIDRDPDAIARARDMNDPRIEACEGSFSDIDQWIAPQTLDGAVFDFGVSSYQLDQAHRGFSFRMDGPLDMRMGPDQTTTTAADIVNTWRETDLANMIFAYGQEPRSRIIAKAIVAARRHKNFTTTLGLAEVIRSVVPRKSHIDPCTLTFQALRICVNNELIEIDTVLKKLSHILCKGGRVVTVSFHELEDRIVKQAFRASYHPLTKKPVAPSRENMRQNPRCRSAKLRAAEVPL